MPNDSTPEIITINSNALEATVRDLLPSQSGFGSELQASNVITPIIDLTATAEGSVLREDLQTALAFGSQTTFFCKNSTTVIANSPGFYRVTAGSTIVSATGQEAGCFYQMSDGVDDKTVYAHQMIINTTVMTSSLNFDFVFFLRAGDTMTAGSTGTTALMNGSVRQVASVTGDLVVPNGFVAE